jgi:hypothetical protein
LQGRFIEALSLLWELDWSRRSEVAAWGCGCVEEKKLFSEVFTALDQGWSLTDCKGKNVNSDKGYRGEKMSSCLFFTSFLKALQALQQSLVVELYFLFLILSG